MVPTEDLYSVQGGQPGPVLPTAHLNGKHQLPGLVKGLSPKLEGPSNISAQIMISTGS